jgi:hypothetical protein
VGYRQLVLSVGEPMATKQKQNPQPHKPTYQANWGYSKRERQNKAIVIDLNISHEYGMSIVVRGRNKPSTWRRDIVTTN